MIDNMIATVAATDPEIAEAIRAEYARQTDGLELIASENVVSEAVLCAMGSVLTNKYAEGYPGKRYYGGCACVDVAETIAIERAKKLFGAAYANVQPHSGAQANTAVYFALIKPGDTVTAGQTIGAVGNTALMESAIGDHLHFAVTCDGKAVNPADFLTQE